MIELQGWFSNHAAFSKEFGKAKTNKLVVSGSHLGRKSSGDKVFLALERMAGERRLAFSFQRNSYDFEVFIFKTEERFGIDIYSAEFDFNFENKIRGCRYDEVISDKQGDRAILGNELEGTIRHTIIGGPSLLFRMVNDGDFIQRPYNRGDSWVSGFDFPASLYRVGMEQYFMDPNKPTQEEFLFAITAENVNAITPKEIAAVEKAMLYVQSQGR